MERLLDEELPRVTSVDSRWNSATDEFRWNFRWRWRVGVDGAFGEENRECFGRPRETCSSALELSAVANRILEKTSRSSESTRILSGAGDRRFHFKARLERPLTNSTLAFEKG